MFAFLYRPRKNPLTIVLCTNLSFLLGLGVLNLKASKYDSQLWCWKKQLQLQKSIHDS